MKNKIIECMNDLMQSNSICNYIIEQDNNSIYIKNTLALDAYMKTLELSKNGNTKCYLAPLGKNNKATNPIFTVIDNVVKLSNCIIK